jgi:Phage head-tail joining protein
MNPGDRDREIVVQTATQTQDPDTGEIVIDWTIGAIKVMAEWLPGNTREAYYAQNRLGAQIEGVFRVPNIARPNPGTQRIVFDGLLYDIEPAVEAEGRDSGWLIPVKAKVEP